MFCVFVLVSLAVRQGGPSKEEGHSFLYAASRNDKAKGSKTNQINEEFRLMR
jgi:hypothetical protein